MSESIHHFNIFGIKIVGLVKAEGYHVLTADVGNRLECVSIVAVINNRLVRHFSKLIEGFYDIFNVFKIFKVIRINVENYCDIGIKL